jgi:dTDP-4-dehydrorhamnose 3,5-epimerase
VKFNRTNIDGAYLLEFEPLADERGFFAETQTIKAFSEHGLCSNLSECSLSFNQHRGTLRGMHYQVGPNEQTKLVTCIRGRVFDVLIDLRRDSESYLEHFSAELSLERRNMLYVPPGVAHGFLTLEDSCYVQYQIGGQYDPDAARGARWNDPAFGVEWPDVPTTISERDQNYEDYTV